MATGPKSSTAFTPGPWRVEENTTLVWGACDPDTTMSEGMGVPVAEARHHQQATWERQRHLIEPDEAVANARLIAAAPDLYEALEMLLLESSLTPLDPEIVETNLKPIQVAEARARAALAKANGEQP